jgi:hypothetical protein
MHSVVLLLCKGIFSNGGYSNTSSYPTLLPSSVLFINAVKPLFNELLGDLNIFH